VLSPIPEHLESKSNRVLGSSPSPSSQNKYSSRTRVRCRTRVLHHCFFKVKVGLFYKTNRVNWPISSHWPVNGHFSVLFSAISTDWQTLHRYFIADVSNHCALSGLA